MFDDFEIPGLDELIDLLEELGDLFDFGGDETIDLTGQVLPLWSDGGVAADFSDAGLFWDGLDAAPLDAGGFGQEFGNMQLYNPFADHGVPTSPIADGSYDDLISRTAVITGIPLDDLPN